MRKISPLLILLITVSSVFAQDKLNKKAQPIVEEGKRLYRSEMASWMGTDIFLSVFEDLDAIGGYFSYPDGDNTHCLFFDQSESPTVLGTISFDSEFSPNTVNVDLEPRKLTELEQDYFIIRSKALAAIQGDPFFKMYECCNFNPIPMIHDGEKKVYLLTGPTETGLVVFGNDYLIEFNKQNKIVEKKALHANILPFEYEEESEGVTGMHSHLKETGDYITATDICTLMLYCQYTGWEGHNVVSEKLLNMWNCETNSLTVVSMKVLEKINEDQEGK